jgi:hypothetical protein
LPLVALRSAAFFALVFFVVAIIDSFSAGVPLQPRLTAPPGNWFRVIVARTGKSFRSHRDQICRRDGPAVALPDFRC